MKAGLILPFLLALTDARTVRSRRGNTRVDMYRREVPQEHSHQQFLNTVKTMLDLNNPNQIQDPVFGLLGDAAGKAGQGKINNTDCLQQATADQAFTNAKAAGNVQGMTAALIYRALERNTGKVGLASVNCTQTPVNAEIAAISQHQDAAGTGAQANNRQVELTLAQQIASVGGDPTTAMMSGTFAPGNVNDPTAKGNSCDDANDQTGCIFTQNLLKAATTADELKQAAAGISANSTSSSGSASASGTTSSSGSSSSGSSSSSSSSSGNSTASSASSGSAGASSNVNLGSCQNAAIKFATGLDGRKEAAFAPVDNTDFNHGSADGIGVITSFICQQLTDKCKAPASTATQCNTAAQAASKQTGQAAADAFNSGLGQTA